MKQSIYNLIDHLRYGGVAVSGLFLLVVIVAELIGDPVLLLGFPFLGDLEVFEAFVLKEFVLGNVLGRRVPEALGPVVPLLVGAADVDDF